MDVFFYIDWLKKNKLKMFLIRFQKLYKFVVINNDTNNFIHVTVS